MNPDRDKMLERIQLDARDCRATAARFSELAGDHTDSTAETLRLVANEEEATAHRLLALGADVPICDVAELRTISDEVARLREHRGDRLDHLSKILEAIAADIRREQSLLKL